LETRHDYNRDVFPYMIGVILRVIIAGWDEEKCQKVYRSIRQWLTFGEICARGHYEYSNSRSYQHLQQLKQPRRWHDDHRYYHERDGTSTYAAAARRAGTASGFEQAYTTPTNTSSTTRGRIARGRLFPQILIEVTGIDGKFPIPFTENGDEQNFTAMYLPNTVPIYILIVPNSVKPFCEPRIIVFFFTFEIDL